MFILGELRKSESSNFKLWRLSDLKRVGGRGGDIMEALIFKCMYHILVAPQVQKQNNHEIITSAGQ